MRKYSYQRALTGISVTHAPLTGINRHLHVSDGSVIPNKIPIDCGWIRCINM